MIKSFGDKETEKVWQGEFSKKLPQSIQQVALRKLRMIHVARNWDDLRNPPANHLEVLRGNLKEYGSIRINDQWRILFIWGAEGAEQVSIVDYH